MEENEMTFWGHLEALRWVLVRVVAVLFLFMIASFCFMPYLFEHVILAPTTSDFPLYQWLAKLGSLGPFFPDFSDDNFHVEIININVASQFMTHISTSFWFALVLIFPYLVFEIWKFIQPALFENERKNVGWAFCLGTGKNSQHLHRLNGKHGFFGEIVTLEHPRYIMQYKLRSKQLYIDKYLEAFGKTGHRA